MTLAPESFELLLAQAANQVGAAVRPVLRQVLHEAYSTKAPDAAAAATMEELRDKLNEALEEAASSKNWRLRAEHAQRQLDLQEATTATFKAELVEATVKLRLHASSQGEAIACPAGAGDQAAQRASIEAWTLRECLAREEAWQLMRCHDFVRDGEKGQFAAALTAIDLGKRSRQVI